MLFLSQRDQLTVERAQELMANPPKLPPGGDRVFCRPRAYGYLLILLSVFILGMFIYSVIRSRGLLDMHGLRAGLAALIALYPLGMGLKGLRYNVRVSNDALIISDLTVKRARLEDISEVKIDRTRTSHFCRISLMTGEEDLRIPSDLNDFPEFVSLLCEAVNEAKARAPPGHQP
jgi:hypothetical protein